MSDKGRYGLPAPSGATWTSSLMRIGKPLLITVTAIGLPIGIYEGFRLAGPFALVMVALIGLFGAGIAWTVGIARREERERRARESGTTAKNTSD